MSWQHDHTHFKCSDHERTAAFFKEHFGATEVTRMEVGGMPIITLEIAGDWFNFSPKRANETLDTSTDTVRYGVYHVAFKTPDLEVEAARMRARGVRFTQDVRPLGASGKMAFIEGPDGISIELLQRG
ncbi:MAG: VOC family protein [Candidatus Latescibacterota bacterium]